jgi:hypothetical protein
MSMTGRRIVQLIATRGAVGSRHFYALCDDGTV